MHGVGVLLDRARFAKVGESRLVVLAVLGGAVHLRERDHRDLQFAGEELQPPADLGDLFLPRVAAVLRLDELQVVDHDQLQSRRRCSCFFWMRRAVAAIWIMLRLGVSSR